MAKFRSIIKSLSLYFSIFLGGIVSTYIAFKVYNKFEITNDFFQGVKKVWGYKIYSNELSSLSFGNILTGILLLTIGIKLAKIISHLIATKLNSQQKFGKGAVAAIENLTYYGLIIIFGLMAFSAANIPLTMFTIFGGALAIGFGFGSQTLLSNFISGVILQVERPVKVGDLVEIEGHIGEIEHIGGRSTKMILSDNKHVIIPNSYFLDKKFINWTLNDYVVRSKIELVYDHKTNLDKLETMILNILRESQVKTTPAPRFLVVDMNESGIKILIYFWVEIGLLNDRTQIESDLRRKIIEGNSAKGFSLAQGSRYIFKN